MPDVNHPFYEFPFLPKGWEGIKEKAFEQLEKEPSLCCVSDDGEEIFFRLVYIEPMTTAKGWDFYVCFVEDTGEVIPVAGHENIILEDSPGDLQLLRFINESANMN